MRHNWIVGHWNKAQFILWPWNKTQFILWPWNKTQFNIMAMEVGTIQNETLELGTIQFFGNGIRHISIRWKRNKAHFILWYWNKGAAPSPNSLSIQFVIISWSGKFKCTLLDLDPVSIFPVSFCPVMDQISSVSFLTGSVSISFQSRNVSV